MLVEPKPFEPRSVFSETASTNSTFTIVLRTNTSCAIALSFVTLIGSFVELCTLKLRN